MPAGKAEDDVAEIRADVLPHYDGWQSATIARIGGGLINRSFLLARREGGREVHAVLQAVSAIFPPEIHDNIVAVTERLAGAGLVTPRLVPTRDGRPYLTASGGGVWRLLTHVAGVSFDVVGSAEQARAAGELVGRFHAAVDGMDHGFVGMRMGVHDTPRHLARLEEAARDHGGHRLIADVRPLADAIRRGAAALPPLPALAPRICHGDLKFNNILFAAREPPGATRAVCLIDLDTVGPLSLAYELGDAWRSWCNRAGEDDPRAVLDLEVMRASLAGYVAGIARSLAADEGRALLLGVEWVSLELAARFATDALVESYFGWDAKRFPGGGEHNLVRARGQWSLHESLVATREARWAMLAPFQGTGPQ
jgi:Ser/Thr protein kinase RdoA (MazF antagonist)